MKKDHIQEQRRLIYERQIQKIFKIFSIVNNIRYNVYNLLQNKI